jgi:hypothetical protein
MKHDFSAIFLMTKSRPFLAGSPPSADSGSGDFLTGDQGSDDRI